MISDDLPPGTILHRVEVNLSGVDLERFVVVAGDLQFLSELPRDRLLSHSEVRLCASVLRKLLVDGQLMSVWKSLTKQARIRPTVTSTDLDSALDKWPDGWVWYGWAGGGITGAARHAGLIMGADIPPDKVAGFTPPPIEENMRFYLDDWLKGTSVAVRTNEMGLVRVSRQTVLTYMANRKGGAHFDPNRQLTISGRKKHDWKYGLLDHGLVRVGHLSGPEFEICSMAQAVSNSEWSRQMVQKITESVPEDFDGKSDELKFWSGQREADGTGWATLQMG